MREMEVMQSFLRESIARDTLAAEIVDLKAEISNLERENKKLVETVKAAPSETVQDEDADALAEIREQLEAAKASHESAVKELKSTHMEEVETLETELENYRRRSSRLEGVETKIGAVQQALEESKSLASQNEKDLQQELQEKEQDRGQLAAVVEELRQEIDRCQLKLDEDATAQIKEKEEANHAAETLRKELEEVKADSAAAVAKFEKEVTQLSEELADERQRNVFSTAEDDAARELRETSAQKVEELELSLTTTKQASKQLQEDRDAERQRAEALSAQVSSEKEEASKRVEQLQEELAAERQRAEDIAAQASTEKAEAVKDIQQAWIESHKREIEELRKSAEESEEGRKRLQAEIDDIRAQDVERSEKNSAELKSSTSVIEQLKSEAEKLSTSHVAELETQAQRVKDSETLLEDLRKQVKDLTKARELEKSNYEDSSKQNQQLNEDLRHEAAELVKTRDAEQATRDESNQSMQQVVEDLQNQLQKLQYDGSDGQAVVGELQTQLVELQQTKADLEAKYKQDLQNLQSTIDTLKSDSQSLEEMRSQALAQKDQESQSMNVVVQELQSKVVELQQQLEDVKHSKEQSMRHMDDVITSLREETRAVKEKSAAQVMEKDNEKDELRKVLEKLQQKIAEHQQSAEDSKVRSETESTEVGKVLEGLQNEVQVLQHKLHDEQAAGEAAAEQRGEIQQKFDSLQSQHEQLQAAHTSSEQQLPELQQLKSSRDDIQEQLEELQSRYDAAASLKQEQQLKMDELSAQIVEANEAKFSAESACSNAQDELRSLQKVLDTFAQDGGEKDTRHANELAKLKKELEQSRDSSLQSLKDSYIAELETLRQKLTTEHGQLTADLRKKLDSLLEEKHILEEKLGDIAMQHNRELEEETEKHEATYKELHGSFTQLKEAQSRSGAVAEEQQKSIRAELQSAMEELKREHAQRISALTNEHASILKEMMNKQSEQLEEIEAAATKRAQDHVAERERAHEAAVAALKAEHTSAQQSIVAEKEQSNQAAVAALNADHASRHEAAIAALHDEHTAIREAALAALRADLSESHDTATDTRAAQDTTAADAIPGSRSLQNRHSLDSFEVPSVLSTPKNDGITAKGLSHIFVHLSDESEEEASYASDDIRSLSPTPPGKHARSETSLRDQFQLRKDNASLSAMLQAAQNEIASLKSVTAGAEGAYALPQTQSDTATGSATSRGGSASTDDDQSSFIGGSTMSLEGTMESLRVQTEQLLELNDDFIAEQRRWSKRLRRDNSTHARSSPLRAAS